MNNLKWGLFALLMLVVIVWAAWPRRPVTAPPDAPAVPATEAPEVAAEPTAPVPVQGGSVKAYRPAVKRKLGLPPPVVNDSGKSVVSASVVPADDHPQEVTAVLDTKTGEVTQYVRERPLPWLAADMHGEAGIYYGQRFGGQAVRLEVRQDLIQVKALRLQVLGSMEQGTAAPLQAFGGVGVIYRW